MIHSIECRTALPCQSTAKQRKYTWLSKERNKVVGRCLSDYHPGS